MKTPQTAKRVATPLFALLAILALPSCDVDKVEDGKMPEIDVDAEPGELPEVEVTDEGEMPSVDVDAEGGELPEFEVEGPDVEVGSKEVEVEVPTVDIEMPDEDDDEEE